MIKYQDLELAFDFVSFGGYSENEAYFSKKTGKFYYISDNIDAEEESIPDDLFESDEYIQVPDKQELDLGKQLVIDFTSEHLADELENVYQVFRKKGAYSRFKELLANRGLVEKWHQYEEINQKKALSAWAKEHDIDLNEK
ncbi:hypothetical protein D5018_08915 [Parashewanella curva]|uniref:Uncharacterized protein n=1 Tax=Parashewanella curva TaxID=2338552 RepID=A0A3L8PX47_9GAMM|nr:hypothetical protein [Parashewanella curva]RLV60027.1 hypothetical protein D5018_08915 [Parashewanella curva]